MAKVPPRKSAARPLSQPIIALANFDKPESAAVTPMHFRVSEEFHREFKLYAVQNGMSMVDLLQASFRQFRDCRAKDAVK